MKKILAASLISLAAPTFALAQDFRGVRGFVESARGIIDVLTLVVAAIALLAFFWGLAQFIFKAGDPKANEGGKNLMIWGTVALFVMVSIWGLVRFIQGELNLNATEGIRIPGFYN